MLKLMLMLMLVLVLSWIRLQRRLRAVLRLRRMAKEMALLFR